MMVSSDPKIGTINECKNNTIYNYEYTYVRVHTPFRTVTYLFVYYSFIPPFTFDTYFTITYGAQLDKIKRKSNNI